LPFFFKAGLSFFLISDKNGNFQAKCFLPNQTIITIIIIGSALHEYCKRMAHEDAKIKYLEHELDQQEKLIQMMEGSASEDRIVALEKKVKEMEALVKGLTQELLDLKSVAMKMSKQTEERRMQELKRGPIVQGQQSAPQAPAQSASGSTVIRPKNRAPEAPAEPAEPVMDMIMQPDGTMKLEPRRGDKDYIVARAGYGQGKKGSRPRQGELIYATEDEQKKDPAKK
jgi:hypothetical protein